MVDFKKIIIAIVMISMVIIPLNTYAAFYDIEYPPNSSGKADFTDQKAEEEIKKETTKKAENYIGKSSNTYLKSLSIENAKIEPEFNRQYVDYNVKLENKKNKKINIKAQAEDEKATIEGIGEIELHDGINELKIIVTAENGNVQIYNLKVEYGKDQSNIELKNLKIYGINENTKNKEKLILNPLFNSNNFEYDITVPNEISSLEIETEPSDGAYTEIKGEKEIEVGKNKINIKVIDEKNKDKITVYNLNITREEKQKENKKRINMSIILGVLVVIIILLLILLKKTK